MESDGLSWLGGEAALAQVGGAGSVGPSTWSGPMVRDEQICRERRERARQLAGGGYRWEIARRSYGTMGRTRDSHHGDPWVAFQDPTGNLAAARVDAEREACGRFEMVDLEPAGRRDPDSEEGDWWARYWPTHTGPSAGWRPM